MKQNIFWCLFLLLTFVVTLPVSWWGMAKADFFYSGLYEIASIDRHIQQFAPKNTMNKLGFEKTSKAERVDLFHEVVLAIHNEGTGLDGLKYLNKSTNQLTPLFTKAEVVHLKDVAVLVNKAKPVVTALIICWLFSVVYLFVKKIMMPSAKRWGVYGLMLLAVLVLILLVGPENIFYQLHVWAFPENHQWFFYYEESLMSTMMKAPDLFAYISVVWGVISVLLTMLLLYLLHLKKKLGR